MYNKNCKLVILDIDIDTTLFIETVMFQMTLVISKVERKLILQKIKDIMNYIKQYETLRTKPSFRYKIKTNSKNKKVVIFNEKKQQIITFIKQLIQQYPKIRIYDIIRNLKLNNLTLRNNKLYHKSIRSILKKENMKLMH